MKRIVIKVGSSTITHSTGLLNLRKIEELSRIISNLNNEGYEIVLVSSGAIAAGRGKMQWDKRPEKIEEKQAMASIGQCELMYIYDKFFSQFSKVTAQMLMTKRVILDETLRTNASNTIQTLLRYGAIPIINENDSVATDEIVYGDNDTLSAITAQLVNADLLIILTDIDGLYDKNPSTHQDAKRIEYVNVIDDSIINMAEDTNSNVGTGGMITKIQAAKIACDAGCDMVIASGNQLKNIYKIMDGEKIGTFFEGRK